MDESRYEELADALVENARAREQSGYEELKRQCGIGEQPRPEFKNKADTLKPESSIEWIEDFCAKQVDTEWLVRGYLEPDCLAVLFGDSSAGKSFMAIDLACHISQGMKWRGKKTKKGVVLYVCGEGKKGLQKRFKAWHDYHDLPMGRVAVRPAKTALCDRESVSALMGEISQFLSGMDEQPVMIVIDTLNRNFGNGNENDSKDMTAFVEGMDTLREATGAAVLVVHHCGHGAKERSRGSIVLHNALDFEYVLSRTGDQLSEYISTLRATKFKDAGEPPELAWNWTLQNLPWMEMDDDDNPVPVTSIVMTPCDVPQCSSPSRRLPAGQRIAMDALRSALVEHGTEDRGVVSVAEDEWREAAYDAGIASRDTTQDARRKAFNRARDALVASKKVACFDGRYWIAHTRTKPDKTGQCPDMSGGMLDGQTGQNRTHPYKGCPVVRVSGIPGQSDQPIQEIKPADPRGTKRNKAEQFPKCSAGTSGGEVAESEEQSGTYSFRNVPPPVPPTSGKTTKPAPSPTNPPPAKDADALAAEGRRLLEEAKTAPSGVKVLETGEYIDDPAPGNRVDLRNRGNRLLEQARKMRLSEDEKRESPPTKAAPTICLPTTGLTDC